MKFNRNIETRDNGFGVSRLKALHDAGVLLRAEAGVEINQDRGEKSSRVWSATANTLDVDSHESIVHPDGVHLDRYAVNPIMYHEHGWCAFDQSADIINPIGRATSIDADPARVNITWEMGEGYEPADRVQKMLEQKIVNMVSVSFVPLRTDFETETRADPNGGETESSIMHIREWLWLETSTVGIGSNPRALIHRSNATVVRYPDQRGEARSLAVRIAGMLQKGADLTMLREAASPVLELYGITFDELADLSFRANVLDDVLECAKAMGSDGFAVVALVHACQETRAGGQDATQ